VREFLQIPAGNDVYAAMVVGHPRFKYRRLVERREPSIKWL
jgi:hypothetical protein